MSDNWINSVVKNIGERKDPATVVPKAVEKAYGFQEYRTVRFIAEEETCERRRAEETDIPYTIWEVEEELKIERSI